MSASEAGEAGRVAVSPEWLIEQVDEFPDARIRFDVSAGAVRISSPDNPNFVGMLALIRWPADKIETVENPPPEKQRKRK